MKKTIVWILVLTLCLSLCACGKKTDGDAAAGTTGTTGAVENNGTTEPTEISTFVTVDTQDATEGTQPTEAPKPTEGTQPTEAPKPTTPAHTHSWKAATCTAPKTCSCGATEGAAAGHNWKNATCTAPKTCTVCGATEGAAVAHTYTDGTCTGCGAAHAVKTFETGRWEAQILFPATDEYGENLEVAMLVPGSGKTWSYRDFFEKNPHGEQVMDELVYKGKTYYNYSFSAAMGGFEYEALANGNVKVDFVWGNGTILELKKESDTKFVVVSSTNANYIPTGTVYTNS